MGPSSTVFETRFLSCGGRMTWRQPKSDHPKLSQRLSHRFCSSAVLYSVNFTVVLWSNDTGNERGDASHNLTFPSLLCCLLFQLPADDFICERYFQQTIFKTKDRNINNCVNRFSVFLRLWPDQEFVLEFTKCLVEYQATIQRYYQFGECWRECE